MIFFVYSFFTHAWAWWAQGWRNRKYPLTGLTRREATWILEVSGEIRRRMKRTYLAYLATRLAKFYERAGKVRTFGDRTASISVIGAVSPPGGDFTEPVTRHTKRFIRCFWALDACREIGRASCRERV